MNSSISIQKPRQRQASQLESLWIFEILLVLMLIGISTGIAVKDFRRTLSLTKITTVIHEVWPIKSEIYHFYALHGYWPDKKDVPTVTKLLAENTSIQNIEISSGSIDTTLVDRNTLLNSKKISFRLAYFQDQPGSSVLWLCGYQAIPKGMTVLAENMTDIPYEMLPIQCK